MPIQNRNGALFLATGIDNSGLYSGLRQAENQIGSFENFVTQSGQRIGAALGIGLGAAGLKSFASEIINVRGEMQMLSTSFEALLGNKASADAMIGGIKDYVLNSPYSITGLSKASQLLLGFGVDAEKIMPTLKQIGDISMGSSERMYSLSLAFAQMSATGKLMGQDLLQMVNAGFNPLLEISRTTGKTINELRKDMENGAISSEMVAQAFASVTSEGSRFYNMAQKQASGIKGLQGTLTSALSEMYNNIGESQNEVIVGGYKLATSLVQNYETVGTALTALIATYGVYKAAMVFNTSIDKTVTVMRYEAEIAELTKLLPLKEQEANADLKTAVASGKLTQAKAEQLIALRAEIQSKLEVIKANQATAISDLEAATASHKAALQRALASKAMVSQRQMELSLAKLGGDAAQIELAQKSLLQAQEERHIAVKARKASADTLAISRSQANAASVAIETMQTSINTATQNANTVSTNVLTAAKTRLITVAKNLWAVLAPNPYILAAAAAVALGYGIYKLATYTTEAEKAIKKFNEEAGNQIIELNGVFNAYKRANEGTEEKKKLLDIIKSKYGEYIKSLIDEKGRINDIEAAQRMANQALKESIALKIKNESITEITSKEIKKQADYLGDLRKIIAKDEGDEVANLMISKVGDIFSDESKTARDAALEAQKYLTDAGVGLDETSSLFGDSVGRILSNLQSSANSLKNEKKNIENSFKGLIQGEPIDVYIPNRKSDDVPMYGAEYTKAKENWEKTKKELQKIDKDKNQFTKKQYEDAVAAEKKAKEDFEKLGGQTKVDKSGESKAKKAQDIIDQNEKIKQLENKQSLDRKRQGEDLANQEIQARISAMQSGAEKIREQKELDNKLEIQALERQKEDYIRKIIQDEREKFDAQEELKLKKNPKYTKKTFDPSSYISNDAISNLSLQMNSLFQQKGNVDLLARPLVDAAKLVEKGWEDAGEGIATVFSSQFGILDKDGKEVEILVTPILPNGDVLSPNELEDYIDNVLQGNDISKADNLGIVIGIGVDPDGEAGDQLHKLQAELLDLKEKYTSIDTSFFDNIIDSTKLRQQNDVLETDKQAWNEYLKTYGDYEDKRLAIFNEYREKIGKAQTQGEKALLAGNRDKELQDLDQTLIEKSDLWVRLFDDASKHTTGYITETIKKVQQLIDYMKGVEGVEIPIGFTPEQIESLKKDPEKVKEILKGLKTQVDELNTRNPFNSLIQGFKDLKKAGKDTEKQYTATNKIISGIQGVREVVGQLSTAFTDLGMNSEDSLAKVMNVMDRTASMAQTGAQIGGAWGAAIGGAIGLTTSLISAFKGKSKAQKDTEQLQDVTSKIETTNNSINRLLEKRIDLINEATAAEAGYLNTLTQEQIKQQQTYVQSMFDRLSGNEIFGKKGKNNNLSLSALMQKEGLSSMEEFVEWWNSNGVNKLIGEGYDLKNEDQWQSIVDSWEELSEAAENAEKAMKEAVTGISFDSLKDSLDDLVKSADTTFEDIGDSFNDHMRTAALKFAKSSYLTNALQDWHDKFAEYAQSGSTDDSFGLTPEETAELRKMYEDAYNKAQGLYDSALDAMGISKEDSDINGITGVAASITQDSANELNGNFYAVRQSLNDVRNINKQTQEYIKVQTGHISDVKEAVSSYKQVFADQLEYQKQIAENTAATASILRDIRDKGIDLRR